MITESQGSRLVQNMLRKAFLQANTRRKDDARRKLDYYNDEQADHIKEMIAENYKNKEHRAILPVSVNIVRKVIKALSAVYLQDAIRTVEGTTRDQEIYASVEDSASLPTRLKQSNRLTKLCGNTLLRPVWRRGRMDLDILTPDILDIFCGDSPEDLRGVMITLFDDSGRQSELQYSLWTAETVQRLDYRFNVISEEQNPYGVLPFVATFSQPPTTDFWQSGADDLMMLPDAVNERLTDVWNTLRFQGFGVGYVKGAHKDKKTSSTVDIGPGSLMFLPENGEIGFAAPNSPTESSIAAIEFLLQQSAITNGIPAASMSLEPTEQSGISRIVGNSELSEMRADDIAMFARVEQQLFQVFRTVWNTHCPLDKMSEAATLRTDFYDPQPVTSPLDQIREWEALMGAGLMSPVDAMIARNPDLSRDDARAELLRVRDELKEFNFAYPAL